MTAGHGLCALHLKYEEKARNKIVQTPKKIAEIKPLK